MHHARQARVLVLVLSLSLLLPGAALAFTGELPDVSDRQVEQYEKLIKKAGKALGEGEHAIAARTYRQALRIDAGNGGNWYNLACAEALRGDTSRAMQALREARDNGWTDAEWPLEDGDLANLHGSEYFEKWIVSVEELADEQQPWPQFAPSTLANSEDEIDATVETQEKAIKRVRRLLGSSGSREHSRALRAWKAASWDRVADGLRDADDRADARYSALKAMAGRSVTRMPENDAELLLTRTAAFRAAHPESERLGDVVLLEAEARFARNRVSDDEDVKAGAGDAFERDLLVLAATGGSGEAVEKALVRLVGMSDDDLDVAGRLMSRLEAVAEDEDAAHHKLRRSARGVYYKLEGLPEFEARTIDGMRLTNASLQGRVTLVDFWATWCGPCRQELPHLKDAYAQFAGRGFEIIGISLDKEADKDEAAFRAWCEENGVTWPQVYDGKGWSAELADHFGVQSIPFPMLVDREGNVAFTDGDLRGEKLLERVDELLARQPGYLDVAGQ